VGRKKHVPQRTCVACRQIRNKRELVRVVRAPDGLAEIDETGKKSGRGAYLCRSASCWRKALEKDALSRVLKMTLTVEHKNELRKFIESLPEECDTGEAEAVAFI
jgi:predicted RNA-binding protein YlxR (DUF448 family)